MNRVDRDELIQKWLESEILRYIGLHERQGGAPLSLLLLAFDPDDTTPRWKQIEVECPEWLNLSTRERSRRVRTTLYAMTAEGRIKTANDDVIFYLSKMLQEKHAPEPSYLSVNVLDQIAERLRDDDHSH